MKLKKSWLKMDKEELQEYLKIMRKHSIVKNKKGKGSYKRKSRRSDEI